MKRGKGRPPGKALTAKWIVSIWIWVELCRDQEGGERLSIREGCEALKERMEAVGPSFPEDTLRRWHREFHEFQLESRTPAEWEAYQEVLLREPRDRRQAIGWQAHPYDLFRPVAGPAEALFPTA